MTKRKKRKKEEVPAGNVNPMAVPVEEKMSLEPVVTPPEHKPLDLAEEIGKYLVIKGKNPQGFEVRSIRKENFAALKIALKVQGFVLFDREELVRNLARTRMVPGNEARKTLDMMEL